MLVILKRRSALKDLAHAAWREVFHTITTAAYARSFVVFATQDDSVDDELFL